MQILDAEITRFGVRHRIKRVRFGGKQFPLACVTVHLPRVHASNAAGERRIELIISAEF